MFFHTCLLNIPLLAVAPVQVTVLHIPGATVAEYTTNACRFATSSLWGNLSCAVLAPPSTYGTVLPKVSMTSLLKFDICVVIIRTSNAVL